MAELIESCRKAASKPVNLVFIPEKFLLEQKVEPWQDLPVWTGQEGIGIAQIDCKKAIAAGLTFRPVDATATDTLAWYRTLPEARREKMRAGLSAEREQAARRLEGEIRKEDRWNGAGASPAAAEGAVSLSLGGLHESRRCERGDRAWRRRAASGDRLGRPAAAPSGV